MMIEAMSNWKTAYGWSGHILVSSDECESSHDDNVVAVPDEVFRRIVADHESDRLDEWVTVKKLGVTSEETLFLATGTCFSEGFTHYGAVFEEAEVRAEPGESRVDIDEQYLAAMKEVYGLDLPPCRLMIGCSSEH